MVALKGAEIDAFVARPDAARSIVLIFGPDAGLVRERAEKIIRASVDDLQDPFALVRLEGDELAGNPLRLVEEANTIPLFGGRRAVWVKPTSRNIVTAVEAVIAAPSPDCRVVIEAGDLRRNAPLRTLCERAKNVAALPCYADSERDLIQLIEQEMREAGLSIAPDARAALLPFLGADRQSSRAEIQKLTLYAHGKKDVTAEDVFAVVADASATATDGVVDAVFAGRLSEVDTLLGKARGAGAAPVTILSAALRQAAQLHRLLLSIDEGSSVERALEGMRPPPHFRRKPLLEAALRLWNSPRLLQAMTQLSDAVLETRRRPDLTESLVSRALLAVATSAKRRN